MLKPNDSDFKTAMKAIFMARQFEAGLLIQNVEKLQEKVEIFDGQKIDSALFAFTYGDFAGTIMSSELRVTKGFNHMVITSSHCVKAKARQVKYMDEYTANLIDDCKRAVGIERYSCLANLFPYREKGVKCLWLDATMLTMALNCIKHKAENVMSILSATLPMWDKVKVNSSNFNELLLMVEIF